MHLDMFVGIVVTPYKIRKLVFVPLETGAYQISRKITFYESHSAAFGPKWPFFPCSVM